jgi:Na+-driven multidrug efflux pump
LSSAAEEAAPAPSPRAAELAALHPQHAALDLAWPRIVENSIAAAGQATIFAFVGHLGAVSTAAVGAAFQFLFLMFPIWRSLSIGTVAHVSRRMGEGRAGQASEVARQSITLGAIFGVAFGVGFVVFASPLLRLLGADEEVVAVASPILALVGAGSVFQTVWFIATSAIRAAGDSRTPMWLAILSVFVTVPIAYLFIDVLHVGAIGAGYAVVTNSAIVCVISLYVLWVGRADLTIRGGKWGLDLGIIRSLFAISLPSAAESTLFSVGILALSGFGSVSGLSRPQRTRSSTRSRASRSCRASGSPARRAPSSVRHSGWEIRSARSDPAGPRFGWRSSGRPSRASFSWSSRASCSGSSPTISA